MVGAHAHLLPSLNSENRGGVHWKSEMPIVAMKSGNSDGAKGHRFEIMSNGYMTRHRADYVHDNTTYSFHTMGTLPVTTVDDSNWEPDGVTLQVRFCEGGSAYHENEIAVATLQKNGLS
jgi:hypothetical protein